MSTAADTPEVDLAELNLMDSELGIYNPILVIPSEIHVRLA